MKVLVTGSTSALGRKVIQLLESEGISVIALAGKSSNIWKLGQELPREINADILIHLAWDRNLSLIDNKISTDLLVNKFKGYKILVSSLSVHTKTKSIYGLSKLYAEQKFLERNGACLRAGLIYGHEVGGIYKQLDRFSHVLPVIPLPFSGEPRFFLSHIDDLSTEILYLIRTKKTGVYFAANYWPHSLSSIVRRLIQEAGKKRILVGINSVLTRIFLIACSRVGRRFALIDSLKSIENQISNSELSALQAPNTNFRVY